MPVVRLEIVTAERLVYSEEVDAVVAPGIDGELGILPRHAPLLTILNPGEIRVLKNGKESLIAVGGGFLEVMGDKITILADTAEHAEEIDVQRSEEALKLAQKSVASGASDMDLERAMATIRKSQARIKVSHHRRRRRREGRGVTQA